MARSGGRRGGLCAASTDWVGATYSRLSDSQSRRRQGRGRGESGGRRDYETVRKTGCVALLIANWNLLNRTGEWTRNVHVAAMAHRAAHSHAFDQASCRDWWHDPTRAIWRVKRRGSDARRVSRSDGEWFGRWAKTLVTRQRMYVELHVFGFRSWTARRSKRSLLVTH